MGRSWPLLLVLALPAPGWAQGGDRLENGARFGAWTVTCEAVAVGETLCTLSQRLVRTDDNGFLAGFTAFWDGDLANRYLMASVPVGVHFPSGLALRPGDEAERLDFAWQVCSTQLCEARLDLTDETMAALAATPEAVAGYRPAIGAEPHVFRIRTEGLAQGLDALRAALAPNRKD